MLAGNAGLAFCLHLPGYWRTHLFLLTSLAWPSGTASPPEPLRFSGLFCHGRRVHHFLRACLCCGFAAALLLLRTRYRTRAAAATVFHAPRWDAAGRSGWTTLLDVRPSSSLAPSTAAHHQLRAAPPPALRHALRGSAGCPSLPFTGYARRLTCHHFSPACLLPASMQRPSAAAATPLCSLACRVWPSLAFSWFGFSLAVPEHSTSEEPHSHVLLRTACPACTALPFTVTTPSWEDLFTTTLHIHCYLYGRAAGGDRPSTLLCRWDGTRWATVRWRGVDGRLFAATAFCILTWTYVLAAYLLFLLALCACCFLLFFGANAGKSADHPSWCTHLCILLSCRRGDSFSVWALHRALPSSHLSGACISLCCSAARRSVRKTHTFQNGTCWRQKTALRFYYVPLPGGHTPATCRRAACLPGASI